MSDQEYEETSTTDENGQEQAEQDQIAMNEEDQNEYDELDQLNELMNDDNGHDDEEEEEELLDRELEDDGDDIDDIENETLDPQNESEEKEDTLQAQQQPQPQPQQNDDHESDQDIIAQMDAERDDNLNYDNNNDEDIEYQEENDDFHQEHQINHDLYQENEAAMAELSLDHDINADYNAEHDMESSAKLNAEEYDDDKQKQPVIEPLDIPQVGDNNDLDLELLAEPKSKEIGIQTILLSTEIKLSSKTKRRIAVELGHLKEATQVGSRLIAKKGRRKNSMSPTMASRQMRNSSQKIAKIIGEHKAQLKVMFDRYSNGLTNKIKLDGLTRMLKDRNILKKITLIPEITKAFHKSSFTDKCPRSLNFDEFLQCIIRMANELLSRKKKLKYRYPESRVSLFLAKLHLRPFPKEENEKANTLSDVVAHDKMTDPNKKSIGSELTQKMNEENPAMNNFDYRLSEKQLDSEFDLYFNTGGFFSDANSSITGTASADIQNGALANNQNVKEMNPLSPSVIGKKAKQRRMASSNKKGKKN